MKPLAQNTLIQNRYLIVHLIGKGGMGEVYLAVDQRLGSAVALKRTFFAGDEMLGNAFEREAKVLARLRHPVLPKVSDHFGENEEQYLVMEHISGDDLSKRIEALQKPFPLSWVMFWADQLLDALSYLHSHEPPIIHRDIKPQNLKLTDENHIVLLDFGLSKSSTGQTNLAAGTGSTGSVVGYTPHYAPMEQIRGIGTSPKSDIYSLSATLYQLMTNVIPADALTRADSLLNGMADPIQPPSAVNPEVPPGVSEVILRGMEVSQEKRWSSAREMQKSLRKAFSEMQTAMSAQTVAFSAGDFQANGTESQPAPSFEATEVMDPAALRAISHPVAAEAGVPFSESISQPGRSPEHLEATVAYTAEPASDPVRQADVKTEVFIGSTGGFVEQGNSVSDPATPAVENFAPTTDYRDLGSPGYDAETPYSDGAQAASATSPIVAFDQNGANADYEDRSASSQPVGGFETVVNMPAEPEPESSAASAAVAYDSRPAAVAAAPVKKKGSTGKIVALLGGLFVFFVVVLAAVGGGYYYYVNYAGAVAEPSPSPAPTIEPSPSPEPTLNTVTFPDNSNSTVDDNSNSSLVVEPTPVPTQATPVPDQAPNPDTRPTPVKPTPKPQPSRTVPKTTPTKKPGGKDLDILQ